MLLRRRELKNISIISLRRNTQFYHFLRPGQGQAVRRRTVLPAELSPAARKSKNISLSNLVIFSTIQILTSPKVILSVIPKGYFAKKEVENAGSYNGRGCSLVGNFCGVTKAICDKTISDETIDAVFEGKLFKIPKRYHEWLTTFYGDYMTLPPEEERVNHGTSVAFILE